jgi:hemolysin activation/secretion protein
MDRRSSHDVYGRACAIAASLLTFHVAQAQTLPRPEQDPAQRLQKEQRERERQRELEQAPPQINVPAQAPSALSMDADIETLPDVEPMFLIQDIEVAGNTVLSEEEVHRVTQPFLNKQLGSNRINLLLRRLTETFVAKGLVTTRAYLGEQNLKGGTLTITVIPGKIEAIQVNGKTLRPVSDDDKGIVNGGLFTDTGTVLASPVRVGEVLKLSDLEQGVDQINRLRRNQAEMQILPGTTPGGSIVAMNNKPGDRFRFSAGTDNYGSSTTGITRTRLELDADNLIGMQEALSASYVGTFDTNALVASASVPYGYHTFSYTVSFSEYQSAIADTALLYGRSLGHTFGWNMVVARSQAGKTATDVTLTHRRSDRSINNLNLDPQDLTVLRIGVNRQQRFTVKEQQAAWSIDVGLSKGLHMNANGDPADIRDSEAHSQFTKVDTTATMALPLGKTGDLSWLWRGQVNAQWARQALFGSEQIFAGGMSSVRGFRDGAISGDRGLYMRNDLIWSNTPEWSHLRLEPYAFLDAGRTELIAQGHYEEVMGTGIGVRLQMSFGKHQVASELMVGRALQQPEALGPKAKVALATINWTY